MKIVIGLVLGYVIFFYVDFDFAKQQSCANKDEFTQKLAEVIVDLAMIDVRGKKIDRAELSRMVNRDPRISYLNSPYATDADYQRGCDALDDIVRNFEK